MKKGTKNMNEIIDGLIDIRDNGNASAKEINKMNEDYMNRLEALRRAYVPVLKEQKDNAFINKMNNFSNKDKNASSKGLEPQR